MNKNAFTLVELIVGITISMLLMMSVGIFVSTGMSNIILQKKIIDDNKKLSSDFLYSQKSLNNSNKYIGKYGSGILIKKNRYFDTGGYSFIGVKEFNKQYCLSGEVIKTNHLFASNFIPYEEIGEDINLDFSAILESEINISGVSYKSDIINHKILKNNGANWETKIGKNIFGNNFEKGTIGTGITLNSPTGIIDVDGKLVFSDTLNNRILYLSGGLVYKLLDGKDGLNEPTGLTYDSLNNILYVANSGSGEILKLSSKYYPNNPELNINFSPEINISNINNLEISIEKTNKVLAGPINISDISLTNFSQNSSDYIELENNKIKYYFLNNYNNNITRAECSGKNTGDLIHNFPSYSIKCTNNTGSGELANYKNLSFNSGTNYNIKIYENKITPSLDENKHYYSNLKLLENTTQKLEKISSYFTNGDNNIFTKDDNSLEILISGLKYPTGIKFFGNNLLINEFETRKQKNLDLNNFNLTDNSNLTAFSENSFKNYKTDFIFNNPVYNFNIKYSIGTKLLNLKIDYYKYLNCFNTDEKIKRSFLLKKNYK